MQDVIIIGGSSAGLSAALILGRARRSVLVFDDGKPCNRFSHASHGFMTRDGVHPADLLQIARDQLTPYKSVSFHSATVTRVHPAETGFSVETNAGDTYCARKLLLATGLHDTLPAVPGLDLFFGTSVFHCPYCDGWEIRDQPVVVYNETASAYHQAMMLHQWTRSLTLCTGGTNTLAHEERARLQQNGITIIDTPAARVDGSNGQVRQLVFADNSTIQCAAVFVGLKSTQSVPFAQDLGCTLTASGLVQVDSFAQTTVPGVYAAGDMSNPLRSVAVAVAHGAAAAYGINHTLTTEDF